MADTKISQLPDASSNPNNGSLFELSEFNGVDSYESKKITLEELQQNISDVAAGTYTPTLTNVTNITASTAYVCQYMRVGNVVTVSGRVDIQGTGTGTTVLRMSLPIASNFTATTQCGGACMNDGTIGNNYRHGSIGADIANNTSNIRIVLAQTGNQTYFFTFTYIIL